MNFHDKDFIVSVEWSKWNISHNKDRNHLRDTEHTKCRLYMLHADVWWSFVQSPRHNANFLSKSSKSSGNLLKAADGSTVDTLPVKSVHISAESSFKEQPGFLNTLRLLQWNCFQTTVFHLQVQCILKYKISWNKHQIWADVKLKKKLEAYYFLQFWNLQFLLMDLLIFHLQNFFQALQVLLNVFIRRQSILGNSRNVLPSCCE